MRKMNGFAALCAALCFVSVTHAADIVPLWADLDDIVTYAPKAKDDAIPMQAAVAKDPRFTSGGAHFLFGLSLTAAPTAMANGSTSYAAVAMMKTGKNGPEFYRKFTIEVGGSPRTVRNVTVVTDIPLSQMHFQATTGLIDRMVLVEDVVNNVTMLFPLGVGGLDENIVGYGHRILTPQYHGAWLDRATIQPHRTNPSYYRGEPFMPITNVKGVASPVAFHITILDDDVWQTMGPNFLVRGFESHACMRMRLKDLQQFFTMIMKGADTRIPLNVDYFVWNLGTDGKRTIDQGILEQLHPYPLEEKSYMQVKNFADPGEPPKAERNPDDANLLYMEKVNAPPNLKNLKAFSADDITDLKDFDGLVGDFDLMH